MNAHTPAPAAVLWDMDGTLIDSEPYWIAVETELVERYGGTWTHEDGLAMAGQAMSLSARMLQERGVPLDVDEIAEYMVARVAKQVRTSIPWQPDARAMLDEVVAAGIPCALVTMAYTQQAEAFLAQAPDVFVAVVTGDTVTHSKPHPEPYLTAAQQLGVDITQCVAIEDSPPGVASALASGARTIGVQRHVPLAPQPGLVRVDSLADVTVGTLMSVRDRDDALGR